MRKSLSVMLLGMATIAFSASASAQAALETLMTHSVSTSVGTHAGTALGNATNGLANRLANQTSTNSRPTSVPRQSVTTTRRTSASAKTSGQTQVAPVTTTPVSGNGSLIASIQGGERTTGCTAPSATTKTSDARGASAAPTNGCAGKLSSSADHPAVVNLPAPQ